MTFGKGEYHEVVPWFGRGYPTEERHIEIVAEMGNNHEGSLGNIIRMIECCSLAGVDAIKIQHHIPKFECTDDEQWPLRFKYHPQDKTRKDYWERMHLDEHALLEISEICRACNLHLIISPFSVESVDIIEALIACMNNSFEIWSYKIASGEVNHRALLERINETKRRVIVSTGMSDTREVNACLSYLTEDGAREIYLLQCTTEYPTPFEHVGINVACVYSRNFLVKGGLSDHSGTIYPSIIAAYLGVHMLEVHVCFDKQQFGADITSSLGFEELRQMVKGVKAASLMRSHPVNKDLYTPSSDTDCYRKGKVRKES